MITYKEEKDVRLIDQSCRLHNTAFPYDCVECNIYTSFTLNDENFDQELNLFAVDEENRVRGFLLGVEIVKEPKEAVEKFKEYIWIKDLAIDPTLPPDTWRAVFMNLLSIFEEMVKKRGKKCIVLHAYAPYYFMPGINILYENYVEVFELYGFRKQEDTVSYEVNLAEFYYPSRVRKIEQTLLSEGITFRRGREEEAVLISEWVGKTFNNPFWRLEVLHSFDSKPPTIWIADQSGDTIGFAVYLRMKRNEFGPTGVDPSKRRRGVGTILLFKALYDLKQLGFRYAVIPWTSHLFFYTQVPGVCRVKHYHIMVKTI
ncbi:MAG: GNAT family N-acetyltransferase [Ignisphaera sp.]|nr:GNAT family N-acetyltransferase [Ignisphaera sp.]MCX8167758.1 GNAT family N-acetyltransferase [Ignisphaera sp.]MDW8085255.1 GNAT family N-acetyltransferase [Ignisphaera sp.]